MHAQKFQIRYSPVQDRVLIIVTGANAQERVFGLTRRLVKRLVPGLRNIMGAETFATLAPGDIPPDPPEPKHSAAAESPAQTAPATSAGGAGDTPDDPSAAAGGPPATAAATPPPDPTHLVTRLRIVEKAGGSHVLQISDTTATLNVPLDRDQIIQFTQGILTVLNRSEWDLDWDTETAAGPAPETAGTDSTIDITADSPSRYRH